MKDDPEIKIAKLRRKMIEQDIKEQLNPTLDEAEIKKIFNERLEVGKSIGKKVYHY